jgi:hypothetical protein
VPQPANFDTLRPAGSLLATSLTLTHSNTAWGRQKLDQHAPYTSFSCKPAPRRHDVRYVRKGSVVLDSAQLYVSGLNFRRSCS